MKRTRVTGGRDNVQKLLHGQRERFAAEIQHAGSGGGFEKLGDRHQEQDSDESTALRERRSRLFLIVFHRGTSVIRMRYKIIVPSSVFAFPAFRFRVEK